MQKLNFTLEVINGAVSILIFFLLVWIAFHLFDRRRFFKSWWALALGIPGGLSLAFYLGVEQSGTLLTRVVVWVWRMTGGSVPFSSVQNGLLILGAVSTGLGILLIIRLLSRPRFGDWPWLTAFFVSIGYVIVRSLIHHL